MLCPKFYYKAVDLVLLQFKFLSFYLKDLFLIQLIL